MTTLKIHFLKFETLNFQEQYTLISSKYLYNELIQFVRSLFVYFITESETNYH